MKKHNLSFKTALATVATATMLVSGSAGLSVLYYRHIRESQRADPAFQVKYLDQKGPLPSHYLEEIVGLCADQLINIHELNVSSSRKKLLSTPLIKAATVKKQLPDTCQIVYELFEPVALLADWENGSIDRDGRLLPFHPFYHTQGLPKLIIGKVENPEWGEKLRLSRVRLAMKILRSIPLQDLKILDVSRVDLPSFGRKQIVVTLDDAILRLNPDDWESGWNRYLKIRPLLDQKETPVIDLRISKIALIQRPQI